jgi:hypothetical protein
MKKFIALSILVVFSLSACKKHGTCPTYAKAKVSKVKTEGLAKEVSQRNLF